MYWPISPRFSSQDHHLSSSAVTGLPRRSWIFSRRLGHRQSCLRRNLLKAVDHCSHLVMSPEYFAGRSTSFRSGARSGRLQPPQPAHHWSPQSLPWPPACWLQGCEPQGCGGQAVSARAALVRYSAHGSHCGGDCHAVPQAGAHHGSRSQADLVHQEVPGSCAGPSRANPGGLAGSCSHSVAQSPSDNGLGAGGF